MKKRCLVLFYLFFGFTSFAQDILWEKSYGGKSAEYLADAIATPDYGFILAGSSLSKKTGKKTEDNRGQLDYWIWKMDEKGDLDWQKSFGGSGSDMLQSITLTTDGGFLLGGVSSSNKDFDKKEDSRGQDDFWIIKLNAKGNEEWQKTIGGEGQEKLQSVIKDKDGGYILAGSSASDISGEKTTHSFGNLDYWVIKLDSKGSIVWQKTYGGLFIDELRSIQSTMDGGYIIGGYSNSVISGNKTDDTLGDGDYWLLKINGTGDIEWQKTIGGSKDDQLAAIYQTYDKNYIVGGNSNSGSGKSKSKSNESGTDFWVLKLDERGEILWQENYNFGKVDVLTSLVENEDHTFLIGGFAQGEIVKNSKSNKKNMSEPDKKKSGTDDFVALKISAIGEELWSKTVGSDGEDILQKAIETRDGSYILAGTSKGIVSKDKNSNIGSNDFWVVMIGDKNKPKEKKQPVEAIPNPASNFTNVIIGYDYKKGTATLVDLAGHVLQTFEITEKTIPIDLQGLSEGIYIVNIATDVQNSGVKIVKTK
ncbi:MAG: T9SS type A sorting domain-containing protein [Flavobacterium sp.]|nr:T9SS type A sorting domain-containing protein [Flavobacterium sp.]